MNIIASQIQLLSSVHFGPLDNLAVKSLAIPKGANVIFGTVVNGVLSVAVSGLPTVGKFVPEQWYAHFEGSFEFPLPVSGVIQYIYAGNVFGTPIIGALHAAKLVENVVNSSEQIVVSRKAR
jgi:hypothetical protein